MVPEEEEASVRASGSARGDVCFKRGYMTLKAHSGIVGVYETTCKSWRCNPCSRKKKAMVVDRLEFGMKQISGPLYFITLTFLTEGHTRRSAESVEKAFRRWCELMRLEYPMLTWFKVVEWTRRRQAHLHLVVGGIPKLRRNEWTCVAGQSVRGKVLEVPCIRKLECLDHKISSMWLSSTNDSYVVYAEGVVGPKGGANYMTKYVAKDLNSWSRMKKAGFGRRWSCSRNWPRYGGLELAATTQEKWDSVAYKPYRNEERYRKEFYPEGEPDDPAFQRVGTDRAIEFARLKRQRAYIAMGRKIKNASEHEASRRLPGAYKHR